MSKFEDLISREDLKKHKVYSEERHEYVVPVYNIDHAPTVKTTVRVTIYDQFGNSIEGYMDKSRNLIFTGYGIIPVKWIERGTKRYTIKEHQEAL